MFLCYKLIIDSVQLYYLNFLSQDNTLLLYFIRRIKAISQYFARVFVLDILIIGFRDTNVNYTLFCIYVV